MIVEKWLKFLVAGFSGGFFLPQALPAFELHSFECRSLVVAANQILNNNAWFGDSMRVFKGHAMLQYKFVATRDLPSASKESLHALIRKRGGDSILYYAENDAARLTLETANQIASHYWGEEIAKEQLRAALSSHRWKLIASMVKWTGIPLMMGFTLAAVSHAFPNTIQLTPRTLDYFYAYIVGVLGVKTAKCIHNSFKEGNTLKGRLPFLVESYNLEIPIHEDGHSLSQIYESKNGDLMSLDYTPAGDPSILILTTR